MGSKVLGLEIAPRSIKFALVKNGSQPQLQSCGIINTAANFDSGGALFEEKEYFNAIAQTIKEMTVKDRMLFKGVNAAAMCVNNAMTIVRPITLPVLPAHELNAAVEFELSKSFPGIAKTNVIAFKEYWRNQSKICGIVSFSPRKTLAPYQKLLEILGYKHSYIDVAANSQAKAFGAFVDPTKGGGVCVLCDIGRSTQFTIVQGKEVLHNRQISEGVGSLYDQLTPDELQEMDIPESELGEISRLAYSNIVNELGQTIKFYNQNQGGEAPIVGLQLLGGGSFFPKLGEYFSAALEIPVSLVTPLNSIKSDRLTFSKAFSAIGAAIRED